MLETDCLEPYERALADGELRLPTCTSCGHTSWPPRENCPACLADKLHWELAPPVGTVFTWTVVGRSTLAAFEEHTPYVVAVIEFAEVPVRIVGFADVSASEVQAGLSLEWTTSADAEFGQRVVWKRV